ncbi:transposase [Dactylosporangium sp. NBC_01737]|uniref:zinc ribbon domain-containing protein n=1 Tax=Dactylosporangium sp. NBC_01737 TaxID=2975959 RepID=UPI002E153607|nr:transposase [Dactylosporangium sp. NBC_01737]
MAGRWYPSSKTCSQCGAGKANLPLRERTYTCTTCGLVLDRDVNAARNLAAIAAGTSTEHSTTEFSTAGSGPVAARGASQKTRTRGQEAKKREPGTAPAGQTGTVPPQGRTTDRVLTRAR